MRTAVPFTGLVLLTGLVAGCGGGERPAAPPVPEFKNLGAHTRKISTASPDAQRYFDEGLNFLFAFNHDEAIRSFREAARLLGYAPDRQGSSRGA
jgi:hypothetical protein